MPETLTEPAWLHDAATSDGAELGEVDLVIGLGTIGASEGIEDKAAAIRAGLDAYCCDHSAALVYVDHGSSDEPAARLARALGNRRVLRVRPSHALGPIEADVECSETFHTVLAAGRALHARAIVMLNADLSSMTPEWIRGLAEPVLKEQYALVLPVYQRNRYEGTLTHMLVAPLIRALFGKQILHPLAEEFGCSAEAADFLLRQDLWNSDVGHQGCEIWAPVAVIDQGLPIGQAVLGQRAVAHPVRPAPLGPTVGRITSTLFALAEGFETRWLETRGSEPVPTFGSLPREPLETGFAVDADAMVQGFRQGVRDLFPIWERILAPDNLGDVLALAEPVPGTYHFPDWLWARLVYDFLLAYRTRVVYRSHVAQSLAPLYLGRAASLVVETRGRPASAVTLATERLAQVFEEQKPYLVDRWR
jgi:hypothetical protein